MWVAQGRLAEALGWAREQGLSVDDDLSYLREFEHVTLARVLIAEYRSDRADRSIHEAMGLLERLLKAAEEGRRMGSVIEILVLQALAHEAQGNISLGSRAAGTCPDAGRAGGLRPNLCRRRAADGAAVVRMKHDQAGRMPEYTGKLLAAFDTGSSEQKTCPSFTPPAASAFGRAIEPTRARSAPTRCPRTLES